MKKHDVYEIVEDALWYRFVWMLIVIGAAIVGVGLSVLAVMFI